MVICLAVASTFPCALCPFTGPLRAPMCARSPWTGSWVLLAGGVSASAWLYPPFWITSHPDLLTVPEGPARMWIRVLGFLVVGGIGAGLPSRSLRFAVCGLAQGCGSFGEDVRGGYSAASCNLVAGSQTRVER